MRGCSWLKELIFPRNCLDCEHLLQGKQEIFCFDCWALMQKDASSSCVFAAKGPACSLKKAQPWAYFEGFSAMLLWKWVQTRGCKRPICCVLPGRSSKEKLFNRQLCRAFEKKLRQFPSFQEELWIGWSFEKGHLGSQLTLFH